MTTNDKISQLRDRLERFATGGPEDTDELIVELREALIELRQVRSAVGAEPDESAVDAFDRGLVEMRAHVNRTDKPMPAGEFWIKIVELVEDD